MMKLNNTLRYCVIAAGTLAASMAVAGAASAQSRVQVENAVARVVVIVEDRSNVAVEIVRGTADLPELSVRRRGDVIEVDGGVRRIRNCRSDRRVVDPSAPGTGARVTTSRGTISVEEAPMIVVRSPREVHVSAGSGVYGAVGRGSRSVSVSSAGCGDWAVASTEGALNIRTAGSGGVLAGTSGELDVAASGSGDVRTGATGSARVRIAGSGDVEIARIDGPANVAIAGSGDVLIRGGRAPHVTVSIAGSGDVAFEGEAGDVTASIAGSGDVRVARATGSVNRRIAGSGNIRVNE